MRKVLHCSEFFFKLRKTAERKKQGGQEFASDKSQNGMQKVVDWSKPIKAILDAK